MSAVPQRTPSDAGLEKPASLHDSVRGSPEPHQIALNKFDQLRDTINAILGPSSGIDSADVDVEEIKRAMSEYESDEAEWQRYAFADNNYPYTRNLVSEGNGKSNLLILVWTPGKSSPIHDHADAHCIMKILKGNVTETLYGWPYEDPAHPASCKSSSDVSIPATTGHQHREVMGPKELSVKKETTYSDNQVTYMSDSLGLHRVGNPSKDEYAVSLHLYTPPNAARHGVNVFNPENGHRRHVPGCHFYSRYGQKTDRTM